MVDERTISESSDSDIAQDFSQPDIAGVLSKWTNYIHGWQDRYIVLKNGNLCYYKSEQEVNFGCRGALSLAKAVIKPHEFDECRIDISVKDCVWYLRAGSVETKQKWIEALDTYKVESGYGTGSENSLRRYGSSVSLQSQTLSTASSSSLKRSARNLREKLAELVTFREQLCTQIETLQKYFDHCNQKGKQLASLDNVETTKLLDFKGEANSFKNTTSAVLDTLDHCADLVNQREEFWRRRLDREIERRKKIENLNRTYARQLQKMRALHPGPDLEEGPHSVLADDEFYDAVESGLDKMDEEHELRDRLKNGHILHQPSSISENSTNKSKDNNMLASGDKKKDIVSHSLGPEIERVVAQEVAMARLGVEESGGIGVWQLFAEDGEMRMYRREEEVNGMVVDPLKAVHVVKGITGHEVCHYFFSPQYRYDWETTLEQMTVLETISNDTIVFHQTHKRIWPASQRDVVFWSHMRRLPNDHDQDGPDMWTVVNQSVEHPDYPANSGKCVRIFLTVCLLCQTHIDPPQSSDQSITRDNITCKITYCSVVNPGGWAPAAVLRAVYKREYPKFLKRFTAYVKAQTQDKPIMH